MSKLLKNTTGSDIIIADVGVTIPANSTFTTQASNSLLWAGSDELVVNLGTGDLVGNDGTQDLSISESVKLFQGLYPSTVVIQDATFTNGSMDVNATVSGSDYMLDIASLKKPTISQINKFGHNESVSSSSLEDIWGGSNTYVWPSAAEKVNIKSTNSSDNSSGTGARTVKLSGLDSNYGEISETINLNGTSNVLSINSYLRLYRAEVITGGTSGENEGEIEATQETSGIVFFKLPVGVNQTLMAIYTVPAGKTAYLVDWYFGMKNGKPTRMEFSMCNFGEVFRVKRVLVMDESSKQTWNPYLKIEEKTDIRVRAKASTGSHEVSSGFNMILVENV